MGQWNIERAARSEEQPDGHQQRVVLRVLAIAVGVIVERGARRVDLAIVYNQTPLEAFDVRPLCSVAMVIVGPPGDPVRDDLGGLRGQVGPSSLISEM
jgi:DNA-binding transcriptional LysR family regulator